jgi:hypothetical protein
METTDIPTSQESSHVEITNEYSAHHLLRHRGYSSLWIHQKTKQSTKLTMSVEIMKRLREAVSTKRPNLSPNDWVLHNDNGPAHKARSVRQFLAHKSISGMEHPPYSHCLAPNDFWLFPKIKSALEWQRFQDNKDIQKMWQWHWKLFHNRSVKNISNSSSIVGLSAQLLMGTTSKVTPLSKLQLYRYEACNKIIPGTSQAHLVCADCFH